MANLEWEHSKKDYSGRYKSEKCDFGKEESEKGQF